jgi:hypothetical protein
MSFGGNKKQQNDKRTYISDEVLSQTIQQKFFEILGKNNNIKEKVLKINISSKLFRERKHY